MHSLAGGYMDKKQRKKVVPAVCFVLVCGVVGLGIHYGQQRKEQIVLEKGTDRTDFETKEADAVPELTKAPEQADVDAVLYVHVCGAVETEGVYELPAGSRLMDGITAAGGFRETADTAYHNLA